MLAGIGVSWSVSVGQQKNDATYRQKHHMKTRISIVLCMRQNDAECTGGNKPFNASTSNRIVVNALSGKSDCRENRNNMGIKQKI